MYCDTQRMFCGRGSRRSKLSWTQYNELEASLWLNATKLYTKLKTSPLYKSVCCCYPKHNFAGCGHSHPVLGSQECLGVWSQTSPHSKFQVSQGCIVTLSQNSFFFKLSNHLEIARYNGEFDLTVASACYLTDGMLLENQLPSCSGSMMVRWRFPLPSKH